MATNTSQDTVTSSAGTYTVPSLKPGTYQVKVVSPGFQTQVVNAVVLVVGNESRVDVKVQAGNVSQTVNVSAVAVNLDTENAAIGQVVTQKEIVDLPLNGRNFTQLLLLNSGAIQNSGEQGTYRANEGNALTIQGARPASNQYFLDGININDVYYQTPAVIPSIDALQEFREQTKGYSAAYGGGANQINLSTKSGTNQIHGTAYDFFRNNALDARNYFDTKTQPLRQNQFGYTLGGPVFIPKVYNGHNRTFFFANYEGLRSNTSQTVFANVPTTAELGGLFPSSEVIVDPITKTPYPGNQIPTSSFSTFGKAVLSNNCFPAPNVNLKQGNYRYVQTLPTDSDQQTYRIDQSFGTKDSIFGRYTQTAYTVTSPNGGGAFAQGYSFLNETSHSVAFNWTRTFTPNTVNQFRFGWLHEIVLLGGVPTTPTAYQSFGLQNLYPYQSGLTLPVVSFRNGQYSSAGETATPRSYTINPVIRFPMHLIGIKVLIALASVSMCVGSMA